MSRTTLLIDRLMPVAQFVRAQWEAGGLRFQPTDVFNRKWLLASLLDAYDHFNENGDRALGIPPDARWLTDVTLESPFAPRFPGDPLGEEPVTVSAVIGNFEPPAKHGEPLRLLPGCRTFTVVDTYLFETPPHGIPGFPWYSRIAQIAASMARTAQVSGICSSARMKRSLVIVAPADRSGEIREMCQPVQVKDLVTKRVSGYRGEAAGKEDARQEWLHDCFLRFLMNMGIQGCDWETAMADSGRFQKLLWFYAGCLCFNRPDGPKAGRCFSRTPRDMPRGNGK